MLIILFAGDIKSLSPEKSPIAMKDVKWSTYNATVGFLVSGTNNSESYFVIFSKFLFYATLLIKIPA